MIGARGQGCAWKCASSAGQNQRHKAESGALASAHHDLDLDVQGVTNLGRLIHDRGELVVLVSEFDSSLHRCLEESLLIVTPYPIFIFTMNPSPLRALASRHLCSCPPQASRLSLRSLTTTHAKRAAAAHASPLPTYGSSELLRRRYQKTPASVEDAARERSHTVRRMRYSAYGIVACALCMFGTIYTYNTAQPIQKTGTSTSLDAPPSIPGFPSTALDETEHVETGTSTVPTFPKTIQLSQDAPTADAPDQGSQEYQLVGLGIRTVSFLGIQVYVVGLYIAVPDIATLQERLVRTLDPVATTLVPGERDKLKDLLLDPVRGEEIWNAILRDGKIRTAFRIVPTRNTDFMHLRDGWVRGITGRTQNSPCIKSDPVFSDATFGLSMNEFKAIWGGGARKNVPKGETLLLTRDEEGKMGAWYEDKNGRVKLGQLADERVSRLIWLGYLGGKTVSSEGARQSVVNGVMEYVERPVGTVATQVV